LGRAGKGPFKKQPDVSERRETAQGTWHSIKMAKIMRTYANNSIGTV